jgi:hypothetical protein
MKQGLFGGKYFSFCEKHFEKRVFYQSSQLVFKKLATSKKIILKITKFCHNCLQYKKIFKIFYFFEY